MVADLGQLLTEVEVTPWELGYANALEHHWEPCQVPPQDRGAYARGYAKGVGVRGRRAWIAR